MEIVAWSSRGMIVMLQVTIVKKRGDILSCAKIIFVKYKAALETKLITCSPICCWGAAVKDLRTPALARIYRILHYRMRVVVQWLLPRSEGRNGTTVLAVGVLMVEGSVRS